MVSARCHQGGFGRNLGEILPTSFPELPLQLRDLRNNQISLKVYYIVLKNIIAKTYRAQGAQGAQSFI